MKIFNLLNDTPDVVLLKHFADFSVNGLWDWICNLFRLSFVVVGDIIRAAVYYAVFFLLWLVLSCIPGCGVLVAAHVFIGPVIGWILSARWWAVLIYGGALAALYYLDCGHLLTVVSIIGAYKFGQLLYIMFPGRGGGKGRKSITITFFEE